MSRLIEFAQENCDCSFIAKNQKLLLFFINFYF